MAPERSTPALIMSIAATVIVAALEKPEKASFGVKTPVSASVAIVASAVISMRTAWLTSSTKNIPRITSRMTVGVIGWAAWRTQCRSPAETYRAWPSCELCRETGQWTSEFVERRPVMAKE